MKTLYTALSLFLLILVSPNYTKAQYGIYEGIQKGYIVKNSGDTIHGYLNFKREKRNALRILFMNDKKGNGSRVYEPHELSAYYGVKGGTYHSKTVQLEYLDYRFDTLKMDKQVFLHLLADGKSSLYHYLDTASGTYYYVTYDQGQLIELRTKKVSAKHKGVSYSGNSKVYLGKLRYIFRDCQAMYNDFEEYPYSSIGLQKAVNDYNQCFEPKSDNYYLFKLKKLKLRYGLALSYGTHNLRIKSNISGWIGGIGFAGSNIINLSAFADFQFPLLNEKTVIRTELSYSQRNEKVTSIHNIQLDEPYDMKFNYANFSGVVRYKFNSRRLQPYFGLGMNFGYLINKDNTIEGNQSNQLSYAIESYSQFTQLGYMILETGIEFNHSQKLAYFLSLRAERSRITQFQGGTAVFHRNFLVTLGVIFG